jgi:hypothetical protein
MITFTRKERTINITIDTSIEWQFVPTLTCSDEPYAILLRQNLADKMYAELTRIRQEAYNQGWKDKSGHKPKKTWFTGRWK